MTNQLLITPSAQFLFAEVAVNIETLPSASVISNDPHDITYLQDAITGYFPSRSFVTEHYTDVVPLMAQHQHERSTVIFADIMMDGFFDLLKQTNRGKVAVVAIVDDVAEEIVTARFLGLKYVVRSGAAFDDHIPHLFGYENALV